MSEKQAALITAAIAAASLAVAVVLPSVGVRPFADDAIQAQIAQEDHALCMKFGFTSIDPQCMAELAQLRQRHERLLVAYNLF